MFLEREEVKHCFNLSLQYSKYCSMKFLLKHFLKMRQNFFRFCCCSWLVIELPSLNQSTTRRSACRTVRISECEPKRMLRQCIMREKEREREKQRAACGERCPKRHQHVGCGQPMVVPANYDVSCLRSAYFSLCLLLATTVVAGWLASSPNQADQTE